MEGNYLIMGQNHIQMEIFFHDLEIFFLILGSLEVLG